jgi:hypothetical protein
MSTIFSKLFTKNTDNVLFYSNDMSEEQKLIACLYYLQALEHIKQPKAMKVYNEYKKQYCDILEKQPHLITQYLTTDPYEANYLHFSQVLSQVYEKNNKMHLAYHISFSPCFLLELSILFGDLDIVKLSFEKAKQFKFLLPHLILEKEGSKQSLLYISSYSTEKFNFFLESGGTLLDEEYQNIKNKINTTITFSQKDRLEKMMSFYDIYLERKRLEFLIHDTENQPHDKESRIKV